MHSQFDLLSGRHGFVELKAKKGLAKKKGAAKDPEEDIIGSHNMLGA